MPYNEEYTKNYTSLKKCNKVYTIVSVIYGAVCIPYALSQLYLMLLTANGDVSYLFFQAVFKAVIFVLGYLGCYKKDNRYSFASVGAALLNIICLGYDDRYVQGFLFFLDDLGFMLIVLFSVLCGLVVYTNKKYHYLEQQEGFPYFNERFEKQKSDSIQYKIKDPYQQRLEEIQKNSSDSMDEI